MVGFFHENWSGTSLEVTQEQKSFNVARKPVLYAESQQDQIIYGRPRSKTLETCLPAPLGTPVRRVPVHTRASSEDTLVSKEDLKLPGVEPVGELELDAHQFRCFTPVAERSSYI